jgi:hypothetical protein
MTYKEKYWTKSYIHNKSKHKRVLKVYGQNGDCFPFWISESKIFIWTLRTLQIQHCLKSVFNFVLIKKSWKFYRIKGIVSRDFMLCFLVSFDRSYISTHQERVLLLLKVHFRIEFFYFRVWAWWAPEGKWRLNLSKYGAHKQEFFFLVMCIINEDAVKKNGTKSWACKKSSV